MQWLNPAGAWAFLALIPIVALYLLKKKAKPTPVSSLFFWRLAQKPSDADRPFQKLKNQLLLWLQLLAAALLALALMRPAGLGGLRGETAFIFDLSASMQTVSNGQPRLEAAKEAAYQMLDEMGEEDGVTLITAGSAIGQPLIRSADHGQARRVIEGLEPENGGADVDGAVALAMAMKRELPGLSVVVLSDSYQTSLENVTVRAVGEAAPNRSIRTLRVSRQESGAVAFAQLWNVGEERTAELECYADGALCDLRTVTLAANGATAVRLTAPAETTVVRVRFAQPDALTVDDERFAVLQPQAACKALLVTEGNVFLEKALSLRDGLTVARASLDDAESQTGYDLIVYDGLLPETLPESGAILALDPPKAVLSIAPRPEKHSAGTLRAGFGAQAEALTQHLLLNAVALKVYRPLEGGEAVLTAGEDTLLAVTRAGERKAAVLGFDLHNSNLPLMADFPVLIQNLLNWLLPGETTLALDGDCGVPVSVALDDRAVAVEAVTPTGRTAALENGVLEDVNEPGLYTISQTLADGARRESTLTLHSPAAESETGAVAASVQARDEAGAAYGAGREWTAWLVALALLVLLAEWEVSRRGA